LHEFRPICCLSEAAGSNRHYFCNSHITAKGEIALDGSEALLHGMRFNPTSSHETFTQSGCRFQIHDGLGQTVGCLPDNQEENGIGSNVNGGIAFHFLQWA
jgi:hypothetical protein